jgi:hypothetical protein
MCKLMFTTGWATVNLYKRTRDLHVPRRGYCDISTAARMYDPNHFSYTNHELGPAFPSASQLSLPIWGPTRRNSARPTDLAARRGESDGLRSGRDDDLSEGTDLWRPRRSDSEDGSASSKRPHPAPASASGVVFAISVCGTRTPLSTHRGRIRTLLR